MLEIINNLSFFFEDNYLRLGVREYARLASLSPPTASTLLKRLTKEGLLYQEEERRYLLFSAQRENSLFLRLQQGYYQVKLQSFLSYLEGELVTPLVILFGSCVRGELQPASDLDIVIFSPSKKEINLSSFEKKIGRPIQLFRFSSRSEVPKHLLPNILNGTILLGRWTS